MLYMITANMQALVRWKDCLIVHSTSSSLYGAMVADAQMAYQNGVNWVPHAASLAKRAISAKDFVKKSLKNRSLLFKLSPNKNIRLFL